MSYPRWRQRYCLQCREHGVSWSKLRGSIRRNRQIGAATVEERRRQLQHVRTTADWSWHLKDLAIARIREKVRQRYAIEGC